MPGRNRVPSFQLASGTTDERDGSYNISNTLGNIFYNTDTSNVEVYHEDPSNNVGWRDLVMNNKEQIDISGNVDISGNLTVDNSLNVGGNITFSDSTVQNTGSPILEYISHYCDGTELNIKNKQCNNGTLLFPNVTTTQLFNNSNNDGGYSGGSTNYQHLSGSEIEYCPPQGTTLLIYELNFQSRAHSGHKVFRVRLEIKDTDFNNTWYAVSQSLFGNTEYGHASTDDTHSLKVPITIDTNDGTQNDANSLPAGKLKNWNGPINLRCTASTWGPNHSWTAHTGVYVTGSPVLRPKIALIAIKQ